ncbi:MAG TPA: PHP domain-containing protein [Chloroflexota bacterium]|nr:PHP domain-containing protein [Chloroflexota bacterium]
MPSTVDLHAHSSVSDGSERPAEVVRKAAANGVRVLALTDHDGTDGLDEAKAAAAAHPGFELIPGIELSAEEGIHVLGYFIRYDDPETQRTLAQLQEGREGRAREIVARLESMGLPLDFTRVRRIADGAIARPHIARAMVERGYVQSVPEAFDRYLAMGQPAYIASEKLTAQQAISIIQRGDGVASWAHPEWPDGPLRLRPTEETLRTLVDAGLGGLEVFYSEHTPDMRQRFLALAERYGLVPTGGSDYHGPEVRDIELGAVDVPEQVVDQLRERASR